MRSSSRDDDSNEFDDDWDDDGYIPCPHCGKTMLEDADYCPSCERWITDGVTNKTRSPLWVVIVAAVLLGLILISAL